MRGLLQRLREDPALAQRVMRLCEPPSTAEVSNYRDLIPVLAPLLAGRDTEALVAIAVSSRGKVIDAEILTTGSMSATVVDPAQVFRWLLTRKKPCRRLILAHNHPSGDPVPSVADREITKQLVAAAKVLCVEFMDHAVWTDSENIYSFAAHGEI